jgi:hypothetical protein
MDTNASNSPPARWSLYADPSIFQIAVRTTDDGWIQMTLEVDPESTQGVGICGTRLLSHDVANGDGSNKELASLSLQLKLEEIPHLIAILNEIYRRHHVEAVGKLEFEPDFEFPQRELLPSGLTLTWPILSRLEPARDPEDWKDRRALLCAFKVLADRLADDVEQLGLLRPIG